MDFLSWNNLKMRKDGVVPPPDLPVLETRVCSLPSLVDPFEQPKIQGSGSQVLSLVGRQPKTVMKRVALGSSTMLPEVWG